MMEVIVQFVDGSSQVINVGEVQDIDTDRRELFNLISEKLHKLDEFSCREIETVTLNH